MTRPHPGDLPPGRRSPPGEATRESDEREEGDHQRSIGCAPPEPGGLDEAEGTK